MARRKPAKSRKRASAGRSPLIRGLYWSAVVGVWAILGLAVLFGYLAHDLPDIDRLPPPGQSNRTEIRAANGSLLAVYGAVYGDWLENRQIPPILKSAIIAIEDRRFEEHIGIDPRAVLRAVFANLTGGGVLEGGSTLTQQLAKNLFLSPDRTLKRKSQELLLALWLEARLSKDEILGLYLNRVYFGDGAYGIDAAARTYFGHSARRLNLSEAAMLAGLLKAPSALAPSGHADRAWERARLVLNQMSDQGVITGVAAASANRPALRPAGGGDEVRYYTDWVVERARELSGRQQTAVIITTTLDPNLQAASERALKDGLDREGSKVEAEQGAALILAPDGAILAMTGGRAYGASQFNRATSARRQPGSAFKPFLYLAGFRAGIEPATVFNDRPVEIDGWSPQNYSGTYMGPMSLRDAFAKSINTIAVQVSELAGRNRVRDMALTFGLPAPEAPDPSIALGAYETTLLELTGAYAGLARGGIRIRPYGILEIRTGEGELLYRYTPREGEAVADPTDVEAVTSFMEAVITDGTGRAAVIDRPAAGKTGTSQDYRDAWFVGFTSDLIAGIWVGNDDGHSMRGVTGGGLPARIWRDLMLEAHAGREIRPLPFGDASGRIPAEGEAPSRSFLDNLFNRP